MTVESRRLSILTAQEIEELYGLPRFTEEDRRLFFDLSTVERAAVGAVREMSSAVHLVLQCGYFKAKRRFFVYERDEVLDDLRYIIQQYFPDRDLGEVRALSKPTRLEQQQIILHLFDYRLCYSTTKEDLKNRAQRVAMLSTQPIYILREILQHLNQQRVVIPGYTFLQDLVGRAVTIERQRIARLLDEALTSEIKEKLEALLQADEGMYRITLLKHEPKDFSHKQLRQEVERRQIFRPLYEFASTFLATTGLSSESVKYYASLVQFYTVYKLQRTDAASVRLYLLCFAYHRFRQINDNLVDAFIHLVDHYEQQAKLSAREDVQRARIQASEDLKAAGNVLDLFFDPSIANEVTFATVKEKAFSLLPPERFPLVSAYMRMRRIEFDQTGFEWAYYAKLSPTIKRNLRQLFIDLTFADRVEDAPLLAAVSTPIRRQASPLNEA